MIRLAVQGAAGRMGRTILGLVARPPFSRRFALAGALERAGAVELGQDTGRMLGLSDSGVTIESDIVRALGKADVVIDFSVPASTMALVEWCADNSVAVVCGTTGFSTEEKTRLESAAGKIALLHSPNMSVGVNLLFHLAERAARILGDSAEPEILEIHHHHKRDAPSGTAQRLKDVVLTALGREEGDVVYGRRGTDVLRAGRELGVHALRGGDVVGDHTVYFFSEGERLELTHRASSRETFAAGALRGAEFLHGRSPGLYSMQDVLQLGE